ncbi:hypothetical protein M426DRAFT_318789 [Hypoxylon sp. CI-4A]|nr:hypothetical protein M426DRAFT_318789 [Hypoxylon sp. CI-4A]
MPGERIVVDGLWRCLCPSVDVTTISRLIGPPRNPRYRPTLTPTHIHDVKGRRGFRKVGTDDQRRNKGDTVEQERIQYLERLAKRSPWVPGALFQDADVFGTTDLGRMPTKTIYAALKELVGAENTYLSVVKLVEYLVRDRKERPNAMLYEFLIRANVDKNHGSAEVAGRLLKEMEKLQIPTTPQIYQALLEVAAVHPDYVLRNKVLFEMKNRWYSPTTDDSISIILGLLRDNQYELALERLEELNNVNNIVPHWLYDIFLYIFGDLGFYEETLSILKHRLKVADLTKDPISLNVWQFLLDSFSRDAFYDGIKYVWDRSVSHGYLNPPDGVVSNVLNTASNHGDATLAIRAIQILSNRGKKLELHHYEALLDIHVQQKDLRKAFTVLCITGKADLRPDLSSTRSIFQVLRISPADTDQALEILHDLRVHYQVPTAAFNVVLEATGMHRGFKTALDLYRGVRQICEAGPDLETYHILLRHCTMRKSMNFLVAEIEGFAIEPTRTTYNHLVRVACLQDSYEQAFRFLEKMRASKNVAGLSNDWWMDKDAALALIGRCVQAEDIRAQELMEECRRRGMSVDVEVQQLLDDFQRQKLGETDEDDGLEQGVLSVEEPVTDVPSEEIQRREVDATSS